MILFFLRRHTVGVAGVSFLGALAAYAQVAAFESIAGDTLAKRQAFAQTMGIVGRQISYLMPLPERVDDLWGYYQWRGMGAILLFFAGWAVVSASGATRGEEEKGLVEQWLATGISRVRLLGTRAGVFLLVAFVATVATQLTAALAGRSEMPWRGLAEQGLAMLVLTMCCFGVTLLVSQFSASRRGAGGLSAALVTALFFVNSLGRTLDGLRPLQPISPFYYYDRSNALVPGGHADWVAILVLALATAVFSVLAAAVFSRRDVGARPFETAPRPHPRVTVPSHALVLRNSVVEALWERRVGLAAWVGSAALLAGFLVSLVRPMTDLINSTPAFRRYFAAFGPAGADPTFIQALWFGLAGPVICIFVVIEVGRWTSDDDEGRLEMLLSVPFARWRVVVERFLAVALELVVLVAASCSVAAVLASTSGLRFDGGAYVRASALLLPLGLAFGGIGACLSSFAPRLTVPALGLVATLSYLLLELGPMLSWPDTVNRLSIFKLYGNPLTEGVDWPGLWAMTAITAIGFVAAVALMQRREVGR